MRQIWYCSFLKPKCAAREAFRLPFDQLWGETGQVTGSKEGSHSNLALEEMPIMVVLWVCSSY